ncbi:MAG: hypothetical protein RL033_5610 [Pseudomonadota bacterium]|jgi:uncharacterized protein (DUF58 family)
MLVPRAPLIVFALVPVALSALCLLEPQVLDAVFLVDVGVVLLALLDGIWAYLAPGVSARISTPEVLSLGQPNTVQALFSSRARRRLSLLVMPDLFPGASSPDLPLRIVVPARGNASGRWRVVPRQRGAHTLGRLFVRYPTPLGLFYRQVVLGEPQPVRVYPDLASLRAYDLLARQDREHGLFRTQRRQGGESEFERLREYSPDDPYRSIDWRATARSHKLIVRQYQLESNQSLMFVIDAGRLMTATSDGVSLFDHALNACLLLAQVAVRKGDRVGLLGFDDAVRAFVSPAAGAAAQRRLIRASYALYPRLVESDYDRAFLTLATRVRKRTLAVLFTQVADDAVAQVVLARARRMLPTHLPLVVLLRDTEIDDLATAPSQTTPDLYARAAAAEELRRRDAFARALSSAGVHVLDVRPAALTPALVNRYLEIKARNQL